MEAPVMEVVLIKHKSRWEDGEDIVGIAASQKVAERYTAELASTYPHCYGSDYGTFYFEPFSLITENEV